MTEGGVHWFTTRESSGTQGRGEPLHLRALQRISTLVRFAGAVMEAFVRNRCPMRAAGLAYATLLSLIPAIAVAISVTSAFLKKEGEEQIANAIQTVLERVIPAVVLDTDAATAYAITPLPVPSKFTLRREPLYALTPGLEVFGMASTPAQATNGLPTAGESLLFNPILTGIESRPAQDGTGSDAQTGPSPEVTPPLKQIRSIPESAPSPGTNIVAAITNDQRLIALRREAARKIHEFIQNTRSGALGVTGIVGLIFLAIGLLAKVEQTFNDIWQVERGRSWFVRIVNYWTTLTLGPLLIAAAITLATGPYFSFTRRLLARIPFSELVFQMLPLLVIWGAFWLLYMTMPNTRVKPVPALLGAMVSGTAWHMLNLCSFLFVSRVVTQFKIYGSLGMVPIFMIGVYLSWLDLLFGAQLAYAIQHRDDLLSGTARFTPEQLSQRAKEFLALRVITHIGACFVRGEPPPTAEEIARAIRWPLPCVRYALTQLMRAGMLGQTAEAPRRYLPSRALERITAFDVLTVMRDGYSPNTNEHPQISSELDRFIESERAIASAISVRDLVFKSLQINSGSHQDNSVAAVPEPEKHN